MIKVPEYMGPDVMKDMLIEHKALFDSKDEVTLFKKICQQYDSEDVFMNIDFSDGLSGFTRLMKLNENTFKYENPVPHGACVYKVLPIEMIFFDTADNDRIYYNKLLYSENSDGNLIRNGEVLVYDESLGFIVPN